jgi:hypothetical protein
MRKAGGTTLHRYLELVAKELHLTLDVGEGGSFEVPGTRTRDDTLYVTHFRDPVKRLVGNFEYEGRWGWNCGWLETIIPQVGNDTSILTDMLKEKERPDSLEYFLRRDKAHNSTQCHREHLYYWCSQNCYTRWLALPTHLCSDVSYDKVFQIAIERAVKQHIIIRLEFLKDPEYVASLERFFGVKGYSHSSLDLYCFNETKLANHLVPYHYPPDMLVEFRKRNGKDYDLLNNLTAACQSSKDTVFPQYSLRSLMIHEKQ